MTNEDFLPISTQLLVPLLVISYAGALLLSGRSVVLGCLFPCVGVLIYFLFSVLDLRLSLDRLKVFVLRLLGMLVFFGPAFLVVLLWRMLKS